MRVGYLTYGLDRSPTGIGRYAAELLTSLVQVAGSTEIVVLATEDSDTLQLGKLCEYHRIPHCRTLPALMSLGNLKLRMAASRYGLDAIHDPNGIAPFLWLGPETRSIVTLCDAFAYVHPESHNRLDNWRYRWYLPYALRRLDAVITISECSRADLINYLALTPEIVDVIPAGVNDRFNPDCNGTGVDAVLHRYGISSPYLLYVGALNDRKNVARLLEAYSRVRQQHPDVHLVIAGRRQWKTDAIEQAVRSLESDRAVHFTGYVKDEDLPALYRSAIAFIFPSLYEGFGLPPLEAMACGTPVITSNVSSLPEVTGNAAMLIDPYDVDDLARAIDRVLRDEALREQLRKNGLERASLFKWQQAALRTLRLYESVLQRSSVSGKLDAAPGEEQQTRAN
jgi:glycosyltransferase involved in cell wall biosynthesis